MAEPEDIAQIINGKELNKDTMMKLSKYYDKISKSDNSNILQINELIRRDKLVDPDSNKQWDKITSHIDEQGIDAFLKGVNND